MWEIRFYRSAKGGCPVKKYLESLPVKTQVKINNLLELLEEMGHELKRPYADYLDQGIRELRVIFSGNQYRVLHFFFMKNYIICTHSFTKKTNKVPPEEIERALRIKKDFETRYARGEYKL